MRFVRHSLLIAACLIALGGCRPLSLYGIEPEGPPEYKLGWEDGCDSGISAEKGAIFSFTVGFRKRPEMANSQLYASGWSDGFTFCRFRASNKDGGIF